jgi:hypothetical protein
VAGQAAELTKQFAIHPIALVIHFMADLAVGLAVASINTAAAHRLHNTIVEGLAVRHTD